MAARFDWLKTDPVTAGGEGRIINIQAIVYLKIKNKSLSNVFLFSC